MNRYQAPPVSYPVGPCVLYRRALSALWLSGAAVVGGLAWQTGRWRTDAALLLVSTAAAAWRAWRTAPQGELRWAASDGWFWQTGDAATALPVPAVVWRGRSHLLLRLAGAPGRLRWLWVERWRDPSRWNALCRAAQAR